MHSTPPYDLLNTTAINQLKQDLLESSGHLQMSTPPNNTWNLMVYKFQVDWFVHLPKPLTQNNHANHARHNIFSTQLSELVGSEKVRGKIRKKAVTVGNKTWLVSTSKTHGS